MTPKEVPGPTILHKENTFVSGSLVELKAERGTWLARLVEHATLDLRVVSSSPMLGKELT